MASIDELGITEIFTYRKPEPRPSPQHFSDFLRRWARYDGNFGGDTENMTGDGTPAQQRIMRRAFAFALLYFADVGTHDDRASYVGETFAIPDPEDEDPDVHQVSHFVRAAHSLPDPMDPTARVGRATVRQVCRIGARAVYQHLIGHPEHTTGLYEKYNGHQVEGGPCYRNKPWLAVDFYPKNGAAWMVDEDARDYNRATRYTLTQERAGNRQSLVSQDGQLVPREELQREV